MASGGKTFSESWHRIAKLRVCLGPTVRTRKQLFRGEIWYVLYDRFNNQFFRLRPEAYEFVCRLRRERTVEQTWEECLQRSPDKAPGQEDVLQLLTQLYFANLLYFDVPADSAKLFERYKKRKEREVRSKLLSIMFFRMPLLDPEFMLRKMGTLLRILVGPVGAAIWLLVVVAAGKAVVENFDAATSQIQGILASGQPAAALPRPGDRQDDPRIRPRLRVQAIRRRSARDGGDAAGLHPASLHRRHGELGFSQPLAPGPGGRRRHDRRNLRRRPGRSLLGPIRPRHFAQHRLQHDGGRLGVHRFVQRQSAAALRRLLHPFGHPGYSQPPYPLDAPPAPSLRILPLRVSRLEQSGRVRQRGLLVDGFRGAQRDLPGRGVHRHHPVHRGQVSAPRSVDGRFLCFLLGLGARIPIPGLPGIEPPAGPAPCARRGGQSPAVLPGFRTLGFFPGAESLSRTRHSRIGRLPAGGQRRAGVCA